jgi:BirA family transcriptional regulator, biotin operon repressor / biotin---[acetyl-CoA-carboxylase] ligase
MIDNEILRCLKSAEGGYTSGEKLSNSLNISRTAIWKHVNSLRERGYEIDATPSLGYKLIKSPDLLLPEEVRFGLKTNNIGQVVHHFDQLGSTNEEAMRLANTGALEGTLVVSENQTRGRGRLGRRWTCPYGKGVLGSLILRPKIAPQEVSKITIAASIAIAETIRKVSDQPAMIKWPNDIMIGDKKVAGILIEMQAEMDMVRHLIIGFGINVNLEPADFTENGIRNATSMKMETNKTFIRKELLQDLLVALELRCAEAVQNYSGLLDKLRQLSMTLGKRIQVSSPDGTIEGQAVDVDENGFLIVRLDSGEQKRLNSGDTTVLI